MICLFQWLIIFPVTSKQGNCWTEDFWYYIELMLQKIKKSWENWSLVFFTTHELINWTYKFWCQFKVLYEFLLLEIRISDFMRWSICILYNQNVIWIVVNHAVSLKYWLHITIILSFLENESDGIANLIQFERKYSHEYERCGWIIGV